MGAVFNKGNKGQVAVETLFAVIILLGLLVVVTVIGIQKRSEGDAVRLREEYAQICRGLEYWIENAASLEGTVRVNVEISRPLWIERKQVFFTSPSQSSLPPSCWFSTPLRLENELGSDSIALNVGSYCVVGEGEQEERVVRFLSSCPAEGFS